MKRTKLQQEYNKLWHYSTKLKEGGKAWERVMTKLEQLKIEIERTIQNGNN